MRFIVNNTPFTIKEPFAGKVVLKRASSEERAQEVVSSREAQAIHRVFAVNSADKKNGLAVGDLVIAAVSGIPIFDDERASYSICDVGNILIKLVEDKVA